MDGDKDQAIGHLEGFGYGGFEAAGIVPGFLWRFIPGLRIETWGTQSCGWLEDDAIHDGFDGVVLALFKAHALGKLGHLAVDASAEALLVERFELFTKLAFATTDDGGVDGDALTGSEGDDALDDLVGGLARDGASAVGAMGLADAGVQQAKVVVDLGDSADGGTRGPASGLLFDGDSR